MDNCKIMPHDTLGFVAHFRYNFHTKEIVKGCGFKWDGEFWSTHSMDKAYELAKLIEDQNAILQLEGMLSAREYVQKQSLIQSRALSSNKNFPVPDGKEYMPFQKAGIEFASSKEAVLIADEMGLGKTIQAIGTVNNAEWAKKILILCPKSLMHNWLREWQDWDVKNLTVAQYKSGSKILPDTDVVIINYDMVKKLRDQIDEHDWDVMICDESHYLKNPKASRTRNILGHGKKINPIRVNKRLFLSGTPLVNRPLDLWTTVQACDKGGDVFGHYMRFIKRYCDAYYDGFGWQSRGASNLEELQTKLRSTFMIRRLKKDVLTELPEKRRQVLVLPMNGAETLINHENALQAQRLQIQSDLENALRAGDSARVQDLREVKGYVIQEIAKARVEIGKAKAPYVVEQIKNAIEQGPVVCFAHHHEVFELIQEGLKDKRKPSNDIEWVKIVGSVSGINRQKAIDDFTSGKVDLFLGGLKAASEGITLVRSAHVIFAEQDWTDATMTQAEDRCHRIGQEHNVLVQQLVLENSYDCNMAHKIREKGQLADLTLNIAN